VAGPTPKLWPLPTAMPATCVPWPPTSLGLDALSFVKSFQYSARPLRSVCVPSTPVSTMPTFTLALPEKAWPAAKSAAQSGRTRPVPVETSKCFTSGRSTATSNSPDPSLPGSASACSRGKLPLSA
jgi:hypothetical protein